MIREIATAMILASGEKVCRVCETPKPLEDFMPRRGAPDGHVGTCRACVAASRRAPDPEDVETAARWASRDAEMDRRADELRVKREEKAARSTGATPDTTTKNPS